MSYKYHKTIMNGAEKLIDGIENIEMFLDDEDAWNFHDSSIYSFNWDRDERIFTVIVEPLGFSPDIDGWDGESTILLDFHFEGCIEVHMNHLDLWSPQYISEISISKVKGGLECWFDGYPIMVCSERLRVDKPRYIETKMT